MENTISAFKNAVLFDNTKIFILKIVEYKIKIGSNMLEMDVWLTKDLEVVVFHDNNLERLCGMNKKVNHFNYDSLPNFNDKISLHFGHKKFYFIKESNENYMPKLEVIIIILS